MPHRYRFLGGRDFYHGDERLSEGDVVELSAFAADQHAALFEPVSDADAGADESADDAGDDAGDDEAAPDDTTDESSASDSFDAVAFVDRTPMAEVIDDLETGDYDDRLDAIEAAEREGRGREGVAEAIADRREATDG